MIKKQLQLRLVIEDRAVETESVFGIPIFRTYRNAKPHRKSCSPTGGSRAILPVRNSPTCGGGGTEVAERFRFGTASGPSGAGEPQQRGTPESDFTAVAILPPNVSAVTTLTPARTGSFAGRFAPAPNQTGEWNRLRSRRSRRIIPDGENCDGCSTLSMWQWTFTSLNSPRLLRPRRVSEFAPMQSSS